MSETTDTLSPKNTTQALSHLAFCALVAVGLARQEGHASTRFAENLFLTRWLATAQKQKRFPKSVAQDIQWLLDKGRKAGPAGKLRHHFEYLWRSCSGNIAAQSDLFRLTYATETLKDQGWDNVVVDMKTWQSGVVVPPSGKNGFYVEKTALSAAFSENGRQLHTVDFRVIGNVDEFIAVMNEYQLATRLLNSAPDYYTLALDGVTEKSGVPA